MAATLIVEDGTGLEDSNSYVDLDELREYWDNSGYDYSALATDALNVACIRATRTLSGEYGNKWPGARNSGTQALDWPRTNAYYTDGYAISSSVVPIEVKKATCELAYAHTEDIDLQPIETGENQKSYSVVVGPIEEKTEWFDGQGTSRPSVTAATDALARLVRTSRYGGMKITRI